MKKLGILCVLAATVLTGCSKDQFSGAEAEVGKEKINPDMPKIPDFNLPPPDGDVHSVKELKVRNRKYFGQEVKVKGVVTWIYDCMTDPGVHTPDLTDDQVKKIIDETPERCHAPEFRMADAADAPEEQTLRVDGVPRSPTATEKKNLDKKTLADVTQWPPVPPLKIGDAVVVDGNWSQQGVKGASSMEGILNYKSMQNTTENWDTATALAPPKKGK